MTEGLHCTCIFRTCVFQYLRFQRPRPIHTARPPDKTRRSCLCGVWCADVNWTIALNVFRLQILRRRQSRVIGNSIHTTEADATQTRQFRRVWRGGANLLRNSESGERLRRKVKPCSSHELQFADYAIDKDTRNTAKSRDRICLTAIEDRLQQHTKEWTNKKGRISL